MRFIVKKLEDGNLTILDSIEEDKDTKHDTIIIEDESFLEKISNPKIQFTINSDGTKIVSKRAKSLGFERFKEGSNKEKAAKELNEYFIARMDPFANVDLAIYMHSLLALADKGYVISDNDKEEKYLEILETEDESLIEMLEEYLICKDNISRYVSYRKTYNEGKEALYDMEDDDPRILKLLNKL